MIRAVSFSILYLVLPLTRVQKRETDDFCSLVPDDDVVVSDLTIRGVAGLLEIDIQRLRLLVARRPEKALRRLPQRIYKTDELFTSTISSQPITDWRSLRYHSAFPESLAPEPGVPVPRSAI
jgi:hypothetical protein